MKSCKINKHILNYLDLVKSKKIKVCNDQLLLCAYVRKCFETEDIYTDDDQLEKYLGLAKYFPFERLFPWEEFCVALHLCTYWRETDRPRWPDLFLLLGRGAGKDGYIAFESFCLISPYSGLKQYDVDICANAEEQAMRPVNDVIGALENPQYRAKMKKFFYWTKESVTGLKLRGILRGRTNNPKSKDGMRSGMVAFNEIHQYENYKNIKVFISGLGKKKHPRRLDASSNGDVRDGPLDDLIARSEQILNGDLGDNGLLPFMCRLDNKKQVHNKKNWEMANPSLPYLPDLMVTIEKEYVDWKESPVQNADFMTKRMNLPQSDTEVAVTDWENINATNKELPDLTGWACTLGIDYMKVTDFASVNLHFRKGELRYDINHSWLCLASSDLHRLKIPYKVWADEKYITLVDDVEIHPDHICNWIIEQGSKYQIKMLALDNYRYALLANSLKTIGFDSKDYKNVKLVRPSDIMKVQPVIDSIFSNHNFVWGDYPPLRWATNNTKLVRAGRKEGTDTGNFYYAKIEAKSRKTDPFMALVASMVIEDELGTGESTYDDLPVIVC